MSEARTVDLSFSDGVRAVELARDSVEAYELNGQREHPGSMIDAFYARTGAFVRLESTVGRGQLRGCAGAHEGGDQLGHAIVEAAIAAASGDSCGSEIEPPELSSIRVSVCIVGNVMLTDDPMADLELGVHGVAVDGRGETGWMYPTLPVEHGWSVPEYLDRTCRKSGLPPGAWEDDDVVVTLFEGAVFRERDPAGAIEQL